MCSKRTSYPRIFARMMYEAISLARRIISTLSFSILFYFLCAQRERISFSGAIQFVSNYRISPWVLPVSHGNENVRQNLIGLCIRISRTMMMMMCVRKCKIRLSIVCDRWNSNESMFSPTICAMETSICPKCASCMHGTPCFNMSASGLGNIKYASIAAIITCKYKQYTLQTSNFERKTKTKWNERVHTVNGERQGEPMNAFCTLHSRTEKCKKYTNNDNNNSNSETTREKISFNLNSKGELKSRYICIRRQFCLLLGPLSRSPSVGHSLVLFAWND